MTHALFCYNPPTKFSRVCPSISQSRGGGGGTCDNCPWCIGPHCKAPLTLTWDPLPWPQPPPDMGYRHPTAWPWSPLDMGHEDPLALRQPPPRYKTWDSGTDNWWPPKRIPLARKRYASYWNAFLLCNLFEPHYPIKYPRKVSSHH